MRRTLGIAIATVMTASLLHMTAPASVAGPERLVPQIDTSVPGVDAPGTKGPLAAKERERLPAPVWPEPGVVDLKPGASGLWASSGVQVEVLPRERALAAGVPGLLMRVSGQTRLGVDYSAFRHAYGADWATRLRLWSVPACAPACPPKPLVSENRAADGTIEAVVPKGLVALAAGESGPAGDYAATPLQPSSTWSAGGSSGNFTWQYPFRTPPAPGDLAPELALDYSSASVDGRMAASNNQPSWVGEGFEFTAGSIERRYKPCSKDGGNGASAGTRSGDLCWATDNAVLTLNGNSTELLRGTDGRWHGRAEDGSRIERRTGAANGDNDGEHWVVTTTDGTQYWFGRNRLPGWASGRAESRSTWTVPVYGNGSSEPCHATDWCHQAWRWNLDHVVDPFGNTISYWYAKETNRYARNLVSTASEEYVRGGYLERIDYGTRGDTAYGVVPMQVLFDARDRCVSANCGTHNATEWPDTPWDTQCTGNPCLIGSPTFWTTKRLGKISTRVGSREVESWTFTHTFPNPGDGTRAGLWLDRIGHTGHVGTAVSLPNISFVGTQLANRVDATDHSPAMNWWRIAHINTESGGSISVTYSPVDCVRGSRMPSAPESNTLRCYPVRWKPLGATAPIIDYFHKYVVTAVVEDDLALAPAGRSPHVVTRYEYLGTPAWHYTDDDGLIVDADKTWSVWRGYGRVRAIQGEGTDRTRTETSYFRGMHGDKLPSGTRSVSIPAAGGAPQINDEDDYAGMVREEVVYDGPTGGEVSATVNEPWRSAPTASRTIDGFTVHARFVQVGAERSRVVLDGGRGHRRTQTRTTFDSFGMPVREDDLGDESVPGDERCVLTSYARNTSGWLMEYQSRAQTFGSDCATGADVISDVHTSYDQQARGAAPTRGAVSQVEELKTLPSGYLVTGRATHDAHGRVTQKWDVRGNLTKTAYSPTGSTVTNHLGWVTATTLEPAWGTPTAIVDANGRRTEMAYDGLGRLVEVWLPGRARSASGNLKYAYQVRNNAPTVVTTSTLNAAGGYVTSYTLHDGLLRERQRQSADGSGGRLITERFYDTVGREVRTNNGFVADGPPSGNLFLPLPEAQIPAQTRTVHDGAGRVTASIFLAKDVEKWRTTTVHGGDRTDITPPAGGVRTSQFFDVRNRTTRLRENGLDTVYSYNRKDQLESVIDAAGNQWTYGYDLRGRRTTVDDPDRGSSTIAYNDAGDVLSVADARGKVLGYTYDSLGRRTALREGSVVRAQWEYDTLAKGHLDESTRYVDGAAYVNAVTGYDDGYRPTGRTITIPSVETGVSGNYSYAYSYAVDGAPATTRMPAVGSLPTEQFAHGYDALGRPQTLSTTVSSAGDDTFLVNGTSYTRFGELAVIGRRYDGGSWLDTKREYEEGTRRLRQLLSTRATSPSLVADINYSYDAAGNVTRIADQTSGDTQCFGQDGWRRLVEAWTPAGGDCSAARSTSSLGGPAPYWQSFSYDAVGNRLSSTDRTASSTTARTYRYPAAGTDQPHTLRTVETGSSTAQYGYDPAGNTVSRPSAAGTQNLTWDVEGRLATSTDGTGRTSYVYDADGNRLLRRDPAGTTLHLPGQDLRYQGGVRTATRYLNHAGQVVGVRTGTGVTWLVGDHQGTAQVAVTAATQAVVVRRQEPFGEPRGAAAAWPTDRGFVGGTSDNTGLTHLGAREYDPGIGRFVSVDPIIDHTTPQQMHGFAYADSSPVTMSDPTGLKPKVIGYAQAESKKGSNKKPKSYPIYARSRPKPKPPTFNFPISKPKPPTFNFPISAPKPTTFNFPMGPESSGPCATLRMNGRCLPEMPSVVRDGNLNNGSTQFALNWSESHGGSCDISRSQIICFGVRGPFLQTDRPMTWGDVLFYPGSRQKFTEELKEEEWDRARVANVCTPAGVCLDPDVFGPDLLGHEAKHSEQWATYSDEEAFKADYIRASIESFWNCKGDPGACNELEVGANPYKGRYWKTPEVGPDGHFRPAPGDPDWGHVAWVIGN